MSSASGLKPRLRRLETIFTADPIYFLTSCTANRQRILANERAHQALIEFAQRGADHGVWVGRYVMMPDHLHLFAAFAPGSVTLSEWMKGLKRHLASRRGGFWQKGFFDHVLRSRESYQRKWTYVLQNPVQAGLVRHAHDWRFQGEIYPLEMSGPDGRR